MATSMTAMPAGMHYESRYGKRAPNLTRPDNVQLGMRAGFVRIGIVIDPKAGK